MKLSELLKPWIDISSGTAIKLSSAPTSRGLSAGSSDPGIERDFWIPRTSRGTSGTLNLMAVISSRDCDIRGLHNDSREIGKDYLFFAYPGAATDGRLYCQQAVDAGANAIIYDPKDWFATLPDGVPCIAFPDLVQHLAAIANRFYGQPDQAMTVTGVTGTNGKTTIAYQLAQAHELLGHHAAYIGTLGQGEVNSLQILANTTPDALCLQNLLHEYQQKNIKQVCIEVSSHALSQQRVECIAFEQAIFTNLTHDHLDYHQTMDAYAAAKATLFACSTLKYAIVNNDASYADLMISAINKSCQLITYGLAENTDVRALSWDVSLNGTVIEVDSPWGKHQITITALGFFNIYNALAVFSSLMVSGYDVERVLEIMPKLKAAPGRMEIVSQNPYAIVDYAHTPDALENVLSTLNKVKKDKIIVVFGCGGDRDKTKRPIMGRIASQYADIAIITSDNPRSEDPEQIISDIEQGIDERNTSICKITDRQQAIAKAMSLANANDIILVAGKGHESYQQIGKIKHEFSDQAEIRKLKEVTRISKA